MRYVCSRCSAVYPKWRFKRIRSGSAKIITKVCRPCFRAELRSKIYSIKNELFKVYKQKYIDKKYRTIGRPY